MKTESSSKLTEELRIQLKEQREQFALLSQELLLKIEDISLRHDNIEKEKNKISNSNKILKQQLEEATKQINSQKSMLERVDIEKQIIEESEATVSRELEQKNNQIQSQLEQSKLREALREQEKRKIERKCQAQREELAAHDETLTEAVLSVSKESEIEVEQAQSNLKEMESKMQEMQEMYDQSQKETHEACRTRDKLEAELKAAIVESSSIEKTVKVSTEEREEIEKQLTIAQSEMLRLKEIEHTLNMQSKEEYQTYQLQIANLRENVTELGTIQSNQEVCFYLVSIIYLYWNVHFFLFYYFIELLATC